MTIQINYKNSSFKNPLTNLVLFVDEKFNTNNLKKYTSNLEFSYINDLLKTCDLKKNLIVFEVSSKKKIILVSIKNNLQNSDIENLGAEFYGRINYGKKSEYFVNSDSISPKYENFIGYFLHGLKLKSYEFNLYKSIKEKKFISINVIGNKKKNNNSKCIKIQSYRRRNFFCKRSCL